MTMIPTMSDDIIILNHERYVAELREIVMLATGD
jgi:hypothetical protein